MSQVLLNYLEGAASGLSVLYRKNGGGANEICSQFGEEFNNIDDLFGQLHKIINNYNYYVDSIDTTYIGHQRCSQDFN